MPSVARVITNFAAFSLANYVIVAEASSFLGASVARLDTDLVKNLSIRTSPAFAENLDGLEALLMPMYKSLPKGEDGLLEPALARYALHRFFLEQRTWSIKALAPNGKMLDASSLEQSFQEILPAHLQLIVEKRLRMGGFSLRGLAALASLVDELSREEVIERLKEVYELHNLDMDSPLSSRTANKVIDTYIYLFISTIGAMPKSKDRPHGREIWQRFIRYQERKPHEWGPINAWLHDIRRNVTGSADRPDVSFHDILRMADEMGTQYAKHFWDDRMCGGLKQALLAIEAEKPGRVQLSAFYATGLSRDMTLSTYWQFVEKVDYLRDVGALDESNPSDPSVIIPNYIVSPTQCLHVSELYGICCKNECEASLRRLEGEVADSSATPDKILEVLAGSGDVTRTAFSGRLVELLRQVADVNDGSVPLHGRLFSQWMHHAFPRECPFPHESGTISPKAPHEWAKEKNHASTEASEEEMVCHVSGKCAGGAEASFADDDADRPSSSTDLPWSDVEELLTKHSRKAVSRMAMRSLCQVGAMLSMACMLLSYVKACFAAGVGGHGAALKLQPISAGEAEQELQPKSMHII